MGERIFLLILISLLIIAVVLLCISCCECFYKTEKSVKFGVEGSVPPGNEGDKENGGGTSKEKVGGWGTEEKTDGSSIETSLEIEKEYKNYNKGTDGSNEEKGKEDDVTEGKESMNEEPTHSPKPLRTLPPTAPLRHPKESMNEDGGSLTTKEKGGEEGTVGKLDGPDTYSSGEEEIDENEEKKKSEKDEKFLENANDDEKEKVNEEVETIAKRMPPPPSLSAPFLSTHSLMPLRILPPTAPWRHSEESVNDDGVGLTTKEKEAAEGKIDGPDTCSSGEDGNDDEKENVNEEVETISELMPPPPPLLPPFLSTHSLKPLRVLPPTAPWRHPKESVNEDGGGLTTKEKEAAGGKIDGPDTYSLGEDGNNDEKENTHEEVEIIVELTPPALPSSSRSSKPLHAIPPTVPMSHL